MAKLTKVGSGFIKFDGDLINLKAFQQIKKIEEVDDYMISFTPYIPSKENWDSGVDGSWVIPYSTAEERDEDFQVIEKVLQD